MCFIKKSVIEFENPFYDRYRGQENKRTDMSSTRVPSLRLTAKNRKLD